jgi:hypothetical protein
VFIPVPPQWKRVSLSGRSGPTIRRARVPSHAVDDPVRRGLGRAARWCGVYCIAKPW